MAEEKKGCRTLGGAGRRGAERAVSARKKVHRRGSKQHQCQEQQEGSRQAYEYTV